MDKRLCLKDRLIKIIEDSYLILCNKISNGNILIENEASMQLQLGIIMGNIGKMYEFSSSEHFSLSLEKVFKIESTCKSAKGSSRCDIYLQIQTPTDTCKAGIELKYFPIDKDEAVTENRFSILMDIENIEGYISNKDIDMGYVITYTTNKNYTNPKSRSYIKIGNGLAINGTIESNNKQVHIKGNYPISWDSIDNNYFLKLFINL